MKQLSLAPTLPRKRKATAPAPAPAAAPPPPPRVPVEYKAYSGPISKEYVVMGRIKPDLNSDALVEVID